MKQQAIHRFARISPHKARLVINLIRNRSLNEALAVLRVTHQRAAGLINKVVRSAWSNVLDRDPNAEESHFRVVEARVDEGPCLHRWRPRAMGRASPIRRRMAHIRVALSDEG